MIGSSYILIQLDTVSLLAWPYISHIRVSDLWILKVIFVRQKNHSSNWCLQGGTWTKETLSFYTSQSVWVEVSHIPTESSALAVPQCLASWLLPQVPVPRVSNSCPLAPSPTQSSTCSSHCSWTPSYLGEICFSKLANSDPKFYIQWELSVLYLCSW